MPSIVQASASLSTVTATPGTIQNDGVDAAFVTLTVVDGSGNPVAVIPAAQCVLAVTGSTNTVTQPTGVTDANGQFSGSFVSTTAEAKTASFEVAGLSITVTAAVSVSGAGFATPDILDNASFETDWDGFTNGGGGSPTAQPETTLARTTDQAFAGVTSVAYGWSANAGSDQGANFWHSLGQEVDELWLRFYFRLATGWSITNAQKFCLFRTLGHDGDPQFGGWQLNDERGLWFATYLEAESRGADLIAKADITTDAWHSLEVNYRRNGDPLPNLAFWFDEVQVTKPDGPDPVNADMQWLGGRLYFGPTRGSSATMNQINLVGTRNAGNTGTGTLWIDRVAISTLGRIGA